MQRIQFTWPAPDTPRTLPKLKFAIFIRAKTMSNACKTKTKNFKCTTELQITFFKLNTDTVHTYFKH